MALAEKFATRAKAPSSDSLDTMFPSVLVGIASRMHTVGATVVEKVTNITFSPLEDHGASLDGQSYRALKSAAKDSDAVKTTDHGTDSESGELNSTVLLFESNADGHVSMHQNNQPNGIGGVCLVM